MVAGKLAGKLAVGRVVVVVGGVVVVVAPVVGDALSRPSPLQPAAPITAVSATAPNAATSRRWVGLDMAERVGGAPRARSRGPGVHTGGLEPTEHGVAVVGVPGLEGEADLDLLDG